MLHAVTPQTPPRLDGARIDAWTRALVAEDLHEIRAAFANHNAYGPDVLWSPVPEDLPVPQLAFLQNYWNERRGNRRAPEITDIDPHKLKPALGYIVLLDVLNNGRDFRIRLYGSIVSAVSGFDLTGKLVAEHPASPYLVMFYCALYRAAFIRGEPVFTLHRPAASVHTHTWNRLTLPFTNRDGGIVRFLSGNVALKSGGQPVLLRL
jgi:PAS domain